MPHVSFQPVGKPLEVEADYVVVGSGAGGASFAVTLARGGASVALVEAGAWREPKDYPSSMFGAMRDLFDAWGTTIVRGRALWPVVQARTVGGTTVINSAICVRTPADIFAQWEREHGVGGDEMARTMWKHQEALEHELCAEVVPEPALGHSNKLAMLGATKAGFESHYMTRYVKGCEGAGQCLQGCKRLKKQSTNLNFVPEVLSRGGALLSCAPVARVVFEGRRAVGVTGHFDHPMTHQRGAKFMVRARKAVIVAASATHTAPLLERSGVKSPALGKFFRAHPGTGIFGVYDRPVDMNVGATQGWASLGFRTEPGLKLETLAVPPELLASRLSGGGTELMEHVREIRHLAMWVHAVRAESAGTVHNGWFGKPVVRYELNRADMERFRIGLGLVAKMHFNAGAKAIIPGVHGLPYKLGPDQVNLLTEGPMDPRRYIAILSHLFGGAVMGSDPSRSVVDGNGHVHGYEGLLVGDAAAIPTNLGVNPQHTIMAMARMWAEKLLNA